MKKEKTIPVPKEVTSEIIPAVQSLTPSQKKGILARIHRLKQNQ